MPTFIRLAAALLATAALCACGSSPQPRFYTLSSGAPPQQAAGTAPFSVAIGAVTVPEIVDRPQLVTRAAGNQVAINEFARWAEPLKNAIPRAIADNLTQSLNGARVITYPQSGNADTDYLVAIEVRRFDSAPGEAATIELLWSVRPPKSGAPKTGRSVVREPVQGNDNDALVAAHGRALAAVSADIANAIRSGGR